MKRIHWKSAFAVVLTIFPQFAHAGDWKLTFPNPFPEVGWLKTHQRACFDIHDNTIAEAMADGVNVAIGGTNAGGPNGFAGGHWVLNKAGDGFVAVLTGTPMEPANREGMKRNVNEVHARGGKVLGEAIRMNMVPWVLAEHPEWQDMPQPGGTPIKPEELAKTHVLGCWNSPYGDFFIRSQVALLKTFDFDGYNLDGFGCWSQCYCPACKRAYQEDAGCEIPLGADVNNPKWRHYVKWRLWRYTKFVQRWTAALKEVKPDFVAAPWSNGARSLVALDGRSSGRGERRDAPRPGRAVPGIALGFSAGSREQSAPCVHRALLPRPDGRPPCLDSPVPMRTGSIRHAGSGGRM